MDGKAKLNNWKNYPMIGRERQTNGKESINKKWKNPKDSISKLEEKDKNVQMSWRRWNSSWNLWRAGWKTSINSKTLLMFIKLSWRRKTNLFNPWENNSRFWIFSLKSCKSSKCSMLIWMKHWSKRMMRFYSINPKSLNYSFKGRNSKYHKKRKGKN